MLFSVKNTLLFVWPFKNEMSGNRVAVADRPEPAGCSPTPAHIFLFPFPHVQIGLWWMGVRGCVSPFNMVPGTQRHFSIEKEQGAGSVDGRGTMPVDCRQCGDILRLKWCALRLGDKEPGTVFP